MLYPVTHHNMASEESLGALKSDIDITGEEEKSAPKELFTLEGIVSVNIR